MATVHPLLIHFPIALLSAALLLELLALGTGREEFSRAAWYNQLLGTIGVAGAVISGISAGKAAHLGDPAQTILQTHQEIAFVATALFAALLLWRLGKRGRRPGHPPWLFVALLGAGVLLILSGAWLGGELVFRFGAGVR